MRERELELLIQRVRDHLESASQAIRLVEDVASSVRDQSVEAAGLQDLQRLRTAQNDLNTACRTLAVAMDDRGTPTAAVARALGVSRGSIINWRRDRDEREFDGS